MEKTIGTKRTLDKVVKYGESKSIYPKHHEDGKKDIKMFIARTFLKDGVRCFYGVERGNFCTSKSDMTIDDFKIINGGGKLRRTNKKNGNEYDWVPVGLKNTDTFECSMEATGNLYCLDIDTVHIVDGFHYGNFDFNNLPEIFKNCPYTKSRNKGNPHIWFKIEGIDHEKLKTSGWKNASDNLNFAEGELLTRMTWEYINGFVYNYDGSIPSLNWDDVKENLTTAEVKKWEEKSGLICGSIDKKGKKNINNNSTTTSSNKIAKTSSSSWTDSPNSKINYSEIEEHVNNIDEKYIRSGAYSSWIDIMWSLKSLGDDEKSRPIAIGLANKCGRDIEEYVDKYYDNYDSSKSISIGTMYNYSKESNEENFKKINQKYKPTIESLLENDDMTQCSEIKMFDLITVKPLADRLINTFGDLIVNVKSGLFVYWEETNRWYNETEKSKRHKLTRYISEKLFEKVRDDILKNTIIDGKVKKTMLVALRNVTSQTSSMNNIITHVLSCLPEKSIEFDNKPFLIGFENGVIDLQNKCEFRQYKFDDYMTLSTKYDYVKTDYTIEKNKKGKDDMLAILKIIQPDEERRELLMQTLCSGLDGRAYQKVFCFTGKGGNGKGLIGSLMNYILGDYYHQPGSGLLNEMEKPNSPSPDMYNLKNVRYVNFSEIGSFLKTAMIRKLSGGGMFCGRLLQQNPVFFKLCCTLVMEFNTDPEFDSLIQEAEYRRLVKQDFKTLFTSKEEKIGMVENGITYVKANTYYETEEFLENAKMFFLDILLDEYMIHINKETPMSGIEFTIPKCVQMESNEFLADQNKFHGMFENSFEKIGEGVEDVPLKLEFIWKELSATHEYYTLSFQQKRTYNKKKFYQFLKDNYNVTCCGKGKSFQLHNFVKIVDEVDVDVVNDC